MKDQKFALKIAHVWHMPAFIEYLNEMDWGDGLQQFRWCDIAKILGGNCPLFPGGICAIFPLVLPLYYNTFVEGLEVFPFYPVNDIYFLFPYALL